MIVLTRRDECRRAILHVTAQAAASRVPPLSEQPIVFVRSFAEAHRASTDATTCVVDLGSVGNSAPEVIAAAHRLRGSRPWLAVVLLTAHANLDLEARVIHGLRDLPRLDLLLPRDLQDSARWEKLRQDQFVEQHAAMIEADLRSASTAEGARLLESPEVKSLLRGAIRIRRVEELTVLGGGQRVGVWRRFKRLWGRSPSEMLSLLRVLWAAHLRHHQHSSADIASVLGFRDTEHCARQLGGRLGLRKSDIDGMTYGEIVSAVASCLVQQAPVRTFMMRAGTAFKRAVRASVVLAAASVGGLDVDTDLDPDHRVSLVAAATGACWDPPLPASAVG